MKVGDQLTIGFKFYSKWSPGKISYELIQTRTIVAEEVPFEGSVYEKRTSINGPIVEALTLKNIGFVYLKSEGDEVRSYWIERKNTLEAKPMKTIKKTEDLQRLLRQGYSLKFETPNDLKIVVFPKDEYGYNAVSVKRKYNSKTGKESKSWLGVPENGGRYIKNHHSKK